MVGKLLLRGMMVGLAAGVLAFIFAHIYGEPMVDKAIAFEEATAQAAGEAAEPELVSRAIQSSIGLATGVLVYGAALGGIFALVFAYVYGRIGSLGARGTAAILGALGFLAVIVIPGIKYPANPPSVGNPDTIGLRTEVYFVMIVFSIAAMIVALNVARRLWPQYGAWNASIIGGAVFLIFYTILKYALPDINEVPESFSAVVLWHFRIASMGIQLTLWTGIALGFGWLVARDEAAARAAKLRGHFAEV